MQANVTQIEALSASECLSVRRCIQVTVPSLRHCPYELRPSLKHCLQVNMSQFEALPHTVTTKLSNQ
jgi:hypothetical protein